MNKQNPGETTNYTDLVDVLQKSVARYPECRLFGTKIDGAWQWITYAEFGRRVEHFRGGLATLGITKGDTVAVISANRLEWAIAAYAAYGLGAKFCPMYEHQHEDDWSYIVEDSGARVLLVATYPIYETVRTWNEARMGTSDACGYRRKPGKGCICYWNRWRSGSMIPRCGKESHCPLRRLARGPNSIRSVPSSTTRRWNRADGHWKSPSPPRAGNR